MNYMFKIVLVSCISLLAYQTNAQSKQDSLDIKQVALDYLEAQHNVNPKQFERAAHPRMVKRTFWKNKATKNTFEKRLLILW
ncbi:nuclear transport factor 2 family protein [Aquimarina macrocephali]|uniref:nuclear transport factor 2 family protein n=1 Tax=Aquimarina macrocephali TaxID=666563 RepID=UPI0004BB120C|nr:nuclear transport factor 2 family protein [Aquimarina macrocephali]